jgi:uncharacterized protein (DUF427 family)
MATVDDYPAILPTLNHVEPVPRRIRAFLGSTSVLDTTRARYVWELPYYPQFYIPLDDVRAGVLVAEGGSLRTSRGQVTPHGLRVGAVHRPRAAKLVAESALDGLSETVRFEWAALDAWFEEDEQIFVHPRSPYVRVDALRSTRTVRVELSGTVLAESSSTVMVFETGLPTRYYFNRTEVDFAHLVASDTVTECPYKGITGNYWSIKVDNETHPDLAWSYAFPTRQLLPISGLVAFYNEKVDIFIDSQRQLSPTTHFFHADE